MTTKYKVGDRVKVIGELHGHGFEVGAIVTITEIDEDNDYLAIDKKGVDWYVADSEVEPVTGFIVGDTYTTRGGQSFLCVHIREDGIAILDDGDHIISSYPEGNNTYGWDDFDVVFSNEVTCKGSYYDYVTEERHSYKIDFQIINGKPDWKNAKVTGV